MSTSTKEKQINNLLTSPAWLRIWENIHSDRYNDEITIGFQGENANENIKYIKKAKLGKVSLVEPNKHYDFLISIGEISEETTEMEKDSLLFQIGKITNFWTFVCTPKNHPLFEALYPIQTLSEDFDWYLM